MGDRVIHFMKYLHQEAEPIRFPGRVEAMTLCEEEQGGLKHVMLGSVAERTVRLAHCPVITIKDADA